MRIRAGRKLHISQLLSANVVKILGEILWDKTINETFAIIQNNKPYYVELQTKNTIDNDYDYF